MLIILHTCKLRKHKIYSFVWKYFLSRFSGPHLCSFRTYDRKLGVRSFLRKTWNLSIWTWAVAAIKSRVRSELVYASFWVSQNLRAALRISKNCIILFPISRSLSTSRRRTDELGYRLERPIHFECKLNEPMHIGMRLLHPAAADHSVSINRQQVQRIFSFSLRSRAVTSFCSWLLLNEWIQRVEHALRKTLVLVVRHYIGGGSSHVEWTAHIRLHYPLFVLQMTISPVCFSMLK